MKMNGSSKGLESPRVVRVSVIGESKGLESPLSAKFALQLRVGSPFVVSKIAPKLRVGKPFCCHQKML